MSFSIVPTHLAVKAMRDNGYKNAAYALAELMDNSIQAGARHVELLCAERTTQLAQRQRRRVHEIAVLDDARARDVLEDLRDRMDLVLLIDNGGYSMDPFADVTRLLFGKMRERFADMRTYFFHNTIYDRVYTDQRRSKPYKVEQLLLRKPDTRLVIFGDATMALSLSDIRNAIATLTG